MKKHTLYSNSLLSLTLSALLLSCGQKKADTDWPEVTIESKPGTRWWWMGNAIDKENLTWNLEAMSAAGMGSVEITPIYGVKGYEEKSLSFLSPEWMEMLGHTISEGKRLGIQVDMNTGTGWPFGGPEVPVEDAATKVIFQTYTVKGGCSLQEKIQVKDKRQQEVAVLESLMAYGPEGEKLDIAGQLNEEGTLEWTAPGTGDWQVIAQYAGKTFQKVKRPAPGGEGLVVNHLDASTVSRYLERFEKALESTGTPWPATFFNDSYEVYGGDWTPGLLPIFEQKRGYKLQDYFPEFLADGETELSRRVISDYRETIGELVKENFSQVWTAWAHKHGAITRNQAHGSPANLLDVYASVDIPECEIFGITDFDIPYLRKDSLKKENDGDPVTLKYASSAAHIIGKQYTSSETFTWLTEHFRTSLSQCKPEIDQVFLSGVNRVFFHGYTYTPREAAWPGWLFYASVNMSPTNSIWRDAPAFFQYITRVQSFLQSTRPDNDFLVYMPVYDMWNDQRGGHFLTFAIHGMRKKLIDFYEAVEGVRNQGYDLDYISDAFLLGATVENGLIKTVGGNTWKALIIPSVKVMPVETLRRIEELSREGATIIFQGHYPEDVPGWANYEERKSEFDRILEKLPESSFVEVNIYPQSASSNPGRIVTGSAYEQLLPATSAKPEAFSTNLGGQYLRKKHTQGYLYFLVMFQNKPVNGWAPLSVDAKSIMIYDPMTGKKGKANTRNENGYTEVYLQMKPGESLFIKTYTDVDVQEDAWIYRKETGNTVDLNAATWTLVFEETSLQPALTTLYVDKLVSWTELMERETYAPLFTGKYTTWLNVSKTQDYEYRLCLGDVRESARIFVNEKEAGVVFAPPFELYIGEYLQDGENLLEIEVTALPANRIAEYDRKEINWRIFHDINIVDLAYKPANYSNWQPIPSGLLGPVILKEESPMK